ncbi:hypothetical protein MTR67_019810, partial [Solanum verrucosum]
WTTIAICSVEGYGSSRNADLVLEFAGISINASPEIKSFTSVTTTVTLYNLQVNGLDQYSSATIFHQSADNATNFEQSRMDFMMFVSFRYIHNYTVIVGLDYTPIGQLLSFVSRFVCYWILAGDHV